MSAGLGETSSGNGKRKPNGRATDDTGNTDTGAATNRNIAISSEADLFTSLLSLSGDQLRAVFERAVTQHNERVVEENQRFEETENTISKRIFDANTQIAKHRADIAALETKVEDFQEKAREAEEMHRDNLDALTKRYQLIEKFRVLLKPKLDGVE